MLAILPVALALQMQLTHAEIEQAFVDSVRVKLQAGWEIVDVRSDEDEVVFTLTRGIAVERHIAHLDFEDSAASGVRVEKASVAPRDRFAPSPFLVEAIKGKGGVEIQSDCGRLYARPFTLDAKAKGAAARKLVAETLKASSDLEQASADDEGAVFGIDLDGKFAELRVKLAENTGKVIAAELRRYEYGPDETTYADQAKMKRHIGASVQSIEYVGLGPVLVGTKERFEIDTTEFVSNDPEGHLTCGC